MELRLNTIEESNTNDNWQQTNMTDYEYVISILAYTNPPGFHFYCNNEKGYFRLINTWNGEPGISGNASAGNVTIELLGTRVDELVTTVNEQFLEKVSHLAQTVPYGEVLNDSDHMHRDATPLGGVASSNANGTRYIKCSIDNPVLRQAFSANVSFRTRMIARVAKLKSTL